MKLCIVNDLSTSKLTLIFFSLLRFDAIYHTVNSFGDYDKIYIGIFENYANVKFKYRNANFVSFFNIYIFFNVLKFKFLCFFNVYKYMHHVKYTCKSLT